MSSPPLTNAPGARVRADMSAFDARHSSRGFVYASCSVSSPPYATPTGLSIEYTVWADCTDCTDWRWLDAVTGASSIRAGRGGDGGTTLTLGGGARLRDAATEELAGAVISTVGAFSLMVEGALVTTFRASGLGRAGAYLVLPRLVVELAGCTNGGREFFC